MPWPVVNGIPLGELADGQGLKVVVCAAYAGTRPPACYDAPSSGAGAAALRRTPAAAA